MKCCKNIKLKEIVVKQKAKIWFFLVFTNEYRKYYVCENCGHIYR